MCKYKSMGFFVSDEFTEHAKLRNLMGYDSRKT